MFIFKTNISITAADLALNFIDFKFYGAEIKITEIVICIECRIIKLGTNVNEMVKVLPRM